MSLTRRPAAGLEPIEVASRDEIASLQLKRMQVALQRAYQNVPHYRRSFDAMGVHPSDLKQLSDLRLFPYLVKSDLREHYPFGLFAVPREQLARIHASSGTSGKPTVVGYTMGDINIWAELVARSIRAAGGRAGDMVHIAYGYGLFTGGLGAHYGAERAGCTVVPMSGGQTEKQVQLIQDFKPDLIMVTPSYMQVLIEEFVHQGLDPTKSSLRTGILGAEPWTEAMRRDIETKANIDAVDIYGLSELMGPGVASECVESKDGPVIWEDHFYPEIVDPITRKVLPDGEEGELVFTSLTKEALPMIRYRTGDLTTLLPPTSRSFRRMAKLLRRADDMLIVRGVNVYPTQIEEIVLQHGRLSDQYQIHLCREGLLDEVEVRCELRPGGESNSEQEIRHIAEWTRARIKALVGISTKVTVLPPESLERIVGGKIKRVIDRRPR